MSDTDSMRELTEQTRAILDELIEGALLEAVTSEHLLPLAQAAALIDSEVRKAQVLGKVFARLRWAQDVAMTEPSKRAKLAQAWRLCSTVDTQPPTVVLS